MSTINTLFPTRGDYVLPTNVTPRRLAARTKRNISHVRKKIQQLADPWIDVDSAIEFAVDELLVHLDEFEGRVDESITYLEEVSPKW